MDSSISLDIVRYVIVAAIITCTAWIFRRATSDGKHLRLPPGPSGWPIIGNLPVLFGVPTCTTDRYRFSQWAREYGDIYRIKLGPGVHMYVLNKMNLVREAFGHSEILGRPPVYHYKSALGPRTGSIVTSNGPEWMVLRRFAQNLFRDLGVGREIFTEVIESEVKRLDAKFGSLSGETCWNMLELLNTAIRNITSGFTFGHQHVYEDDDEVAAIMYRYAKATGPAALVTTSKFLCDLPFGPGETLKNVMNDFKRYLQSRIAQARSEMESENQSPNNFVKAFLLEMRKGETCFCEENLIACCLEMFFAGTETGASTLAFAILLLTTHHGAQVKCQEELANFVQENGSLPSYSDRNKLPYVQATIMESERFACVAPLGVFHAVEDDNVKLFGYDFPKGTLVVANFDFMNMDEKEFAQPYEFRPERFMKNGNVQSHPGLRPFSTGRRSCPGEPLARMELFLILANLLHNFTFTVPPHTGIADHRAGVYGLTRSPLPFGVDIRRREH